MIHLGGGRSAPALLSEEEIVKITEEHPVQIGSTITNGDEALRITERVQRDSRWRASGWRGANIGLEEFGGNVGMTSFVPDYLLSGWRHVPFEWERITGGRIEERYVWAAGYRRLQREVRRIVMPTVDGIRGHLVLSQDDQAALRHYVSRIMSEEDALRIMADLARNEGLTEAGTCVVDSATGWCQTHKRVEG